MQGAPAGGEASRATGDRLELRRQADRRDGVVELERLVEFEQHDVVAGVARRPAVLGVRNHLDDAHAPRVGVRLADVVHADDDHRVLGRRHQPGAAPQRRKQFSVQPRYSTICLGNCPWKITLSLQPISRSVGHT